MIAECIITQSADDQELSWNRFIFTRLFHGVGRGDPPQRPRLRRAVLPNPTAAERANGYLACLYSEDEGQGQASANAVAEEDDDDSGSDEPHEVAYLQSLKRQRTK